MRARCRAAGARSNGRDYTARAGGTRGQLEGQNIRFLGGGATPATDRVCTTSSAGLRLVEVGDEHLRGRRPSGAKLMGFRTAIISYSSSTSRCARVKHRSQDLCARVIKDMSGLRDDNYWALGALRRACEFYSAIFVYQTLFVANSSGAIGSVYEGE